MSSTKRPLSPFMLGSHYKLQVHSLMSFLHRVTGVAFIVDLLAILIWLAALACSRSAFDLVNAILTHWAFFPFLIAGCISACYHTANGVRHLVWDCGLCLDIPSIRKSERVVQIATAVLSIMIIIAGLVS